MKSTLSIDWLSYFGNYSPIKNPTKFELKKREYGTRVFAIIEDVVYKGKVFATICYSPYSHILNANMAIIKFENFTLYDSDFCELREFLLNELGFEVKGISRLDIALDFNYFENGLDGHTFISKFLKSEYLHNGRGKFSVNGAQKFSAEFEYLRLGSGKSESRVYLYNKTKELQDVKDKPYIREKWEQNGLDTNKPVWRLEVSMGSQAFELYDTETGAKGIEPDFDFRDMEQIAVLFQTMVNKLFCFKKNNGTRNKTRMETLNLVSVAKTTWVNVKTPAINESGRRERILLRNLYKFAERFGNGQENITAQAERLKAVLVENFGMQSYFHSKKALWDSQQ